ncbi:hypothetical protein M430DRAFT_38035 [Amorphotheca resinae ATCC 22711]|uniref:Calcofluor white hypersensitive protein n=1 Tax=Amorphotheca resinae ATCC 22711 TaxID=857342 RepID=A0A2T3BCW5_AMORE|nr:hypothetical protein M430DRAFT_38035 [Amorphotheca resinae ATCC 22711]PSS27236.1 hypothetical protein M430DRAFT_38035 [Amorphotheca resinae ATCC 22711]
MAQPKSRTSLYVGLAAAGGVGYYLYTAGGSPKVAEKKFQSDVAEAQSKIKSEIPGRENEAKKNGEKWAAEAGAKIDNATDKAREELSKAEGKLDQYRKEAGAKIDETDRKIEEGVSKTKSGISSWFGGK